MDIDRVGAVDSRVARAVRRASVAVSRVVLCCMQVRPAGTRTSG